MVQAGEEIPWPNKGAPNSANILYRASFEVTKHYSKKNAKTIGWRRSAHSASGRSPFIMSNASARDSKRELSLLLLRHGVHGVHAQVPITGMAVHGLFIVELQSCLTKKGQINQKAGDLDNIVTSYLDLLIDAGVLSDDSFITSISAFKRPSKVNKIHIWLFKDEVI